MSKITAFVRTPVGVTMLGEGGESLVLPAAQVAGSTREQREEVAQRVEELAARGEDDGFARGVALLQGRTAAADHHDAPEPEVLRAPDGRDGTWDVVDDETVVFTGGTRIEGSLGRHVARTITAWSDLPSMWEPVAYAALAIVRNGRHRHKEAINETLRSLLVAGELVLSGTGEVACTPLTPGSGVKRLLLPWEGTDRKELVHVGVSRINELSRQGRFTHVIT